MVENQSFRGSQDEEYDVGPMQMGLGGGPFMYPSMMYQHSSEGNRFHVALQRQGGAFHNMSNKAESSFISRGVAASVDMGVDGSSLVDGWDMSAERGLLANGLTDDDILEMVCCILYIILLVNCSTLLQCLIIFEWENLYQLQISNYLPFLSIIF